MNLFQVPSQPRGRTGQVLRMLAPAKRDLLEPRKAEADLRHPQTNPLQNKGASCGGEGVVGEGGGRWGWGVGAGGGEGVGEGGFPKRFPLKQAHKGHPQQVTYSLRRKSDCQKLIRGDCDNEEQASQRLPFNDNRLWVYVF